MPEKPKKVKAVPSGYALDSAFVDPLFPNRKYYKKAAATAAKTMPTGRTTPMRKARPSGVVNRVPRSGNKMQEMIDRVYMEDDPALAPVIPQTAYRTENMFGPNQAAIGQAMYPIRTSTGIEDSGMLNTQNEIPQFQYYKPNTAIPDTERGTFEFDT